MQGSIYDYDQQRWTTLDTTTDVRLGQHLYETPDGVMYEVNPDNPDEYRNAMPAIERAGQ